MKRLGTFTTLISAKFADFLGFVVSLHIPMFHDPELLFELLELKVDLMNRQTVQTSKCLNPDLVFRVSRGTHGLYSS